jgi:hypothetical protein
MTVFKTNGAGVTMSAKQFIYLASAPFLVKEIEMVQAAKESSVATNLKKSTSPGKLL